MGLDMYLTKRTFIKNWNFQKPEAKHEVIVKKGGIIREDIKPERIAEIIEEVMYWRKANQIHNWFVENVQNGDDNCKEYIVYRDQLQELLELCKKVKENPELAEELLPTTAGFFFGDDEYKESYFKEINYTIESLEALLAEDFDDGDYYYCSSW